MFPGLFLKKNQIGFRTAVNFCQIIHVQGYLVSNLLADIFISFLFMKDFLNFWTKISQNLAKFVWEVPYLVLYTTGLDNGGKIYV